MVLNLGTGLSNQSCNSRLVHLDATHELIQRLLQILKQRIVDDRHDLTAMRP